MKTLKNLTVLFLAIFSLNSFATSLHPDTYVKPMVKVKFSQEAMSYYFEVRDHGTVMAIIENYKNDEDVRVMMPAQTEKKHYFLSSGILKKVTALVNKLRYAKSTTQRFEITCMAMPSPLYTSFVMVRNEATSSNEYRNIEFKTGPCAKEITELTDEKDVQLKNKLTGILLKSLKDQAE